VNHYPEHNHGHFYKFATIETSRLILERGNFRYSSPANFNDPFDIQSELYFDFIISDLPNLVTEEVDALVQGRRIASLNKASDWCKAITLLQEKHHEGKYKREHLDFLVKPLVSFLSTVIEDTRNKYNQFWEDQLKRIRVFCVSEHIESILMWSHYANYHTGVCFKLKVMPEKDNPICAAKKVNYVPFPPSFFSVKDWIDSIVQDKDVPYKAHYHNYPLTKSNLWAYEDEWRVWAPFEEDGNSYLDIPIVEGEIDSVYFGVNADPKLIKNIVHISKQRKIERFFRCEKKVKEYGLTYTEI